MSENSLRSTIARMEVFDSQEDVTVAMLEQLADGFGSEIITTMNFLGCLREVRFRTIVGEFLDCTRAARRHFNNIKKVVWFRGPNPGGTCEGSLFTSWGPKDILIPSYFEFEKFTSYPTLPFCDYLIPTFALIHLDLTGYQTMMNSCYPTSLTEAEFVKIDVDTVHGEPLFPAVATWVIELGSQMIQNESPPYEAMAWTTRSDCYKVKQVIFYSRRLGTLDGKKVDCPPLCLLPTLSYILYSHNKDCDAKEINSWKIASPVGGKVEPRIAWGPKGCMCAGAGKLCKLIYVVLQEEMLIVICLLSEINIGPRSPFTKLEWESRRITEDCILIIQIY